MSPYGGYHGDHVNFRARQDLHLIGGYRHIGVSSMDASEGLRIFIADCYYVDFLMSLEIPNYIRTPITVSNNSYPQDIFGKRRAKRNIPRGSDTEASSHPDSPWFPGF